MSRMLVVERDAARRDGLVSALTDAGFRELFRWSPIRRIKRPAFLRNVCVALGNTGTLEDIPALEMAANDAQPLIQEHALWAMAEIRLKSRLT